MRKRTFSDLFRWWSLLLAITLVVAGFSAVARAQQGQTTPQPDSVGYPPGLNAGSSIDLTWPIPADPKKPTFEELVANVAHNKISVNTNWTLITGYLVMFMQAGFALVEVGFTRAKNAAHTMSMNFLVYSLGMLGFWILGFGLMFGGYWNGPVPIGWQPTLGQGLSLLNGEFTVNLFGKPFGLFGTKGFFLNPSVFDTAVFALFLFQMVFMDTAATIPTGAMAERWNFKNFFIYGFWVGMIPYALFGNWVWGGGWLSQLGMNFGLGHGHVDFAGSSVVHECGGVIALVGAWLLGPRLGKFGSDGKPRPIPGHNIPFAMLGTFILAFGWFGFNPGSTLAGTDLRVAVIATNTMLASAAGAVAAALVMWIWFGKPDPSMMCNGMLAGLVAITAPCAFVNAQGAVLLGAIAGVLVVASVFFVERVLKVDDPVGAVSVHGTCGAWGVLSLGLFANGSYGAGWAGVHKLFKNGALQVIINDGSAETVKKYNELVAQGWTDQGVTGLLGPLFGASYADAGQFFAECIGALTCFVAVGALSFVWFKLSDRIIPMRSKPEAEVSGLDVPEMGAEAYPDYQVIDRSSPKVEPSAIPSAVP
ncbi:ammonium transporter [Candidatus Methylacidithermus pantelleriae]|uniref:Ammonium/ammonia transporter n=1 Tax=Candidatus Methylacidithermus pantelleriae TaxID=2744239 RepID=A0A8J2FSD7_9BACT|nr:ammonium transporter [Candidatus Methylacidithermus pantelleriae]CAF0698142.1 Ammonium/ammonia transporter [Candidatus Methylacidithermus pantelleriae]